MRASITVLSLFASRLRVFRRDRKGIAAIELALVSPILLLVMVAMVDFGLVLYVRLSLNEAVSASANYAIAKASQVSETNGPTLATNLVNVMPPSYSVTVVVNNGPAVTRPANGTATSSGTNSNANLCYCPTVAGTVVTWGSPQTCGASCTSTTGRAGKFVTVNANTTHTPLFSNYGYIQNGAVSLFTIAQVQ